MQGKSHLAQKRRLLDRDVRELTGGRGISDLVKPARMVYDDNFWNREKGQRRLRPEQERFLDTKRFDRIQSKFDKDKYRQSRTKEEELYCSDCDVYVRTRDQMQAHQEGKEHRRRSGKVPVFECKLCLVKVPCQDTLDNHMRGKTHLKRAKELTEARKARGETTEREEDVGYMTGPLEMARLTNNEKEELSRLRKDHAILQGRYKELLQERDQLRRQVRLGRENQQEDRKPKEEKPSPSHRQGGDLGEYFEYEEKDFKIKYEYGSHKGRK